MGGIPLISNFDLASRVPLDKRFVQDTLVDRDAIPAVSRYEGLQVFVTETHLNYQLTNGVENINWKEISIIGTNGMPGVAARGVSLTSTDQVFQYNTAGAVPSPSTATLIASAVNTTGLVYYDFLVNGVSVQNDTTGVYTYTPKASFINMPETISVQIREVTNDSAVLATGVLTMVGLKEGSSGITVLLSRTSVSLAADDTGVITSYSGSGTSISAWSGATRLTVDQNYPYGNNTFRVTNAVGTHITPNAAPTGSDGSYSRVYGNHSAMSNTEPNATITYTIIVKNSAGVETTYAIDQSFGKSIAGQPGIDGSGGNDGRTVSLTSTKQGFVYDTAGNYNDVATATFTATATNTTGVVHYDFYLDDVLQVAIDDTDNTYVYTPPATYAGMPDKIEVWIREDSDPTIKARDQMTTVGLRAGTHGATISLSNEAHTLPTTPAGVVDYTGSGTDINAWHGATQLTYDSTVPYGNNTFRIDSIDDTDITVGSASYPNLYTIRFGQAISLIADTASIAFTITIKDEDGQETTYTRSQSLAKSKYGVHASSVFMTNEAVALPADSGGVVTSYSDSGTEITAWHGTVQLTYDGAVTPANNTFKVGVTVSSGTITLGSASTIGSARVYAVASAMTTPTAAATFTITVKDEGGNLYSFTKVQNFAKVAAGLPGADGVDGSAGLNARSVALTSTKQGFIYNTAGAYADSPTTTTVTATATNTIGTVYYEFFVDDGTVQNTTSNTYTYTPAATYAGMPDKIEVQIREGANTGPILARDQMTMTGLKAGTHGATINLSNEAHTVPTDSSGGSVVYTGSGTDITAWHGSIPLAYDDSGSPANSTFRVTNIIDTDINVGSATTPSTYVHRYGDSYGMIANVASIVFTIVIKDEAGTETTYTRTQSISKSRQGIAGGNGSNGISVIAKGSYANVAALIAAQGALQDGWSYYDTTDKKSYVYYNPTWYVMAADGSAGAPGNTGPSIVFRGVFSAATVYSNNSLRRDIVKYPTATDPAYIFKGTDNTSGVWAGGNWDSFGANYTSVATEVLFASLAYIDNLGIRIGQLGGWTIDSDSLYHGTKVTGDNYALANGDITIRSDGSIHTKNFYVNSNGTTSLVSSVNATHLFTKIASNNQRHANDAEEYRTGTTYTFGLVKSFTFTNGLLGGYRVYFEHKKEYITPGAGYVQIHKNGVAIGTERTTVLSTWSGAIAEDFTTILPGDIIELRVYGASSVSTYVRNFRIDYDNLDLVTVKVT